MIVVRDIFQIRFGQTHEATALWKQGVNALKNSGFKPAGQIRLLTDLVGTYYTIVLESTFNSLADWEKASETARANADWKSVYIKIVPLTESGRREILTVIE